MTKLGEGPRWRGSPAGAGTGRKHLSVNRLGAAGLGRRGWRGGRGCVLCGARVVPAPGPIAAAGTARGVGVGGGPAGAFVRRAAAAVADRGAADSGGTGRGGGPFPAVGQ